MKQEERLARRRRRITAVCICLYGLLFLFGAGIVGKAWTEDAHADDAYTSIRTRRVAAAQEAAAAPEAEAVSGSDAAALPQTQAPGPVSAVDFADLQAINGDIVAWLYADGSVLDYPVLHAADNTFYLTHLFTGEKNRGGSLFVDYRNTGLFTDKNTVIYGHSMRNGTMFGSLSDYARQGYVDARPTMRLYTPDGDYTVELFAGSVEDGSYPFLQTAFAGEEAFLAYVDGFRARSVFASDVRVEAGDRIVTMCTCSSAWDTARFVLMGRLTAAAN